MVRAGRRRRGVRTKTANLGAVLLGVAAVLVVAALLVPGLVAGVGRLVGGLWVTVMGAVAGLLGGIFGG